MIKLTPVNGREFVSTIEFHYLLNLSDRHYARNIKSWIYETEYLFQDELEIMYPRHEIDFYDLQKLEPNKIQNGRVEFFISKELSKLIAINSKSDIKRRYVQWLLKQEHKIENFDYLTLDQVLYVIDLINCFKFITNQKAAERYHKDEFIGRLTQEKKLTIQSAAKIFNKIRSENLDIKPDDIKERLERYFSLNNKFINIRARRDMLFILDKFGLIKIAVFDFLSGADKPSKIALKVGEIAKQMASRMNIEIREKNVPDLFHHDYEVVDNSMLERINPYLKKIDKRID